MNENSFIDIFDKKRIKLSKVYSLEKLYKTQNGYLTENNYIIGIHFKNFDLPFDIVESIFKITSLKFLRLVNVNLDTNLLKKILCKELEVLSLSRNNLKRIPLEISNLKNLQELSLSRNDLKKFPLEILSLKNLKVLSLAGNGIDLIPKEINKLENLYRINLSENLFKKFPNEIISLNNLSHLNIASNNISVIPKEIVKLENLTHLILSQNILSEFPKEFKYLKNLQFLSILKNKLKKIPKEITELENLKILNLSENELFDFTSIEKLENLEELALSKNQLTEFPKEILKLSKLLALFLNKNQLKTLPNEIECMKSLKKLDLSRNDISFLPNEIGKLENLHSLSLSFNQIKVLPKDIGKLKYLSSLTLSSNKIISLPDEIGLLLNLKNLNLSNNKLSSLVEGIGKLKKLKTLNLSSNQLDEFPKEVLLLENLKHLRFKNLLENDNSNKIKIIPSEFINLKSLESFDIDPKYLEITYMTAFKSGLNHLKNTINQKMKQGVEKLYEAKLLFVGEPGAGKTSLMEKILDKNYELTSIDNNESTLGINIKKYEFPYVKNNEIVFRTNMWDFGGQQVQYMSHQFFLTPNSLYILVGDDRKQNTNFDYWFHIINLLSDDSPILVVLNEINHSSITNFDLKAFKERFSSHIIEKEDIDLSNMSDGRYEELVLKIKNRLCNLTHIGEELPARWIDIRKELDVLSKTEYYISFESFEKLAKKYSLSDEDINTLSRHFHNLGIFLHYVDDISGLSDIIFLNPKWVMDAIYSVLANTHLSKNNGRFTKKWLFEFWDNNQNRYSLSIKNKLLTLMLKDKFEICYSIDEEEETYISPQLLSSILEYDYNWDYTDNLFYRFQYPFMPKGIISRLIVRLNSLISEENKTKLVWQKGVVLEYQNAKAQVIEKKTKDGLKVIDIAIHGKNLEKQNLLSKIKFEVENIHKNSFQNIDYDEMIPCSCSECIKSEKPEYYKFNILKNFVVRNSFDIKCNKSTETVNIDKLLGNIVIENDTSKEAELFKMLKDMGGITMTNINTSNSNSSTSISDSMNMNQTQSVEITISQTLNQLISELSSLERKVEEHQDKEEITEIINDFKQLGENPSKEEIRDSGLLSDLKDKIEDFDETIQKTGKVINKSAKAIRSAKALGRTYNDLASLCGLPNIPFFIVKE